MAVVAPWRQPERGRLLIVRKRVDRSKEKVRSKIDVLDKFRSIELWESTLYSYFAREDEICFRRIRPQALGNLPPAWWEVNPVGIYLGSILGLSTISDVHLLTGHEPGARGARADKFKQPF